MRIYMGLNILLREDLALDALRDWQLSLDEKRKCSLSRTVQREMCKICYLGSGEVNVGVREDIFANLALLAIPTDIS